MVSSHSKVLVADDDEIVLALVTHILTRQGYLVQPTAQANDVARLLRGGSYHAALIDWTVARSEAWLRELLMDAPSLANRIVVSGAPALSADIPIHSILKKPLEFDVLISTIADCVKESD